MLSFLRAETLKVGSRVFSTITCISGTEWQRSCENS